MAKNQQYQLQKSDVEDGSTILENSRTTTYVAITGSLSVPGQNIALGTDTADLRLDKFHEVSTTVGWPWEWHFLFLLKKEPWPCMLVDSTLGTRSLLPFTCAVNQCEPPHSLLVKLPPRLPFSRLPSLLIPSSGAVVFSTAPCFIISSWQHSRARQSSQDHNLVCSSF